MLIVDIKKFWEELKAYTILQMVYCACDTNKKDKQVLTQNLLLGGTYSEAIKALCFSSNLCYKYHVVCIIVTWHCLQLHLYTHEYKYKVFNLIVDCILIWVIYLLRFTTYYIIQLKCIYSKCWKWCPFISMHLSTCFIMFLATFLNFFFHFLIIFAIELFTCACLLNFS
jgi:hypothetical protein